MFQTARLTKNDRVPRSGVGPGISWSRQDRLNQAVIDDRLTRGSLLKAVIVSRVM